MAFSDQSQVFSPLIVKPVWSRHFQSTLSRYETAGILKLTAPGLHMLSKPRSHLLCEIQ
jgi:hypothetical protein